jgi:hypothetical protein
MNSQTMPELPAERCGNCARAGPADDGSGILHDAGWMHCDLMRAYEYCSPGHACHFSPSRWTLETLQIAKPERKP